MAGLFETENVAALKVHRSLGTNSLDYGWCRRHYRVFLRFVDRVKVVGLSLLDENFATLLLLLLVCFVLFVFLAGSVLGATAEVTCYHCFLYLSSRNRYIFSRIEELLTRTSKHHNAVDIKDRSVRPRFGSRAVYAFFTNKLGSGGRQARFAAWLV